MVKRLAFIAILALTAALVSSYDYYETTTECPESTTLPNPTTPEITTTEESESSSTEESSCSSSSDSSADIDIDTNNKNMNHNRMKYPAGYGDSGSDSDGCPEFGQIDSRQCRLYLPFDDANDITQSGVQKVEDHSEYGYDVEMQGTWHIENDTARAAHGRGSLYMSHGEMKVPCLKDIFECGHQTTMCFWVKCENCKHGTIFSNREDDECCDSDISRKFSMVVEIIPNDDFPHLPGVRIRAKFGKGKARVHDFIPTTEDRHFGNKGLPFEFQQYCVMYDGENITVTNNANWKKSRVSRKGRLSKTNNPARFGNDQVGGPFFGWLDEIIICDRMLTWTEINAHFAGRLAMENQGMIPADTDHYDYTTDVSNTQREDDTCGHNEYWPGTESRTSTFGIVGGREMKQSEFPWTVLFQTTDHYYHCHGTLVGDDYPSSGDFTNKVVTSGLCCLRMEADGLANIKAYLGVTETGFPTIQSSSESDDDFFGPPTGYAEVRNISGTVIHPDYDEAIYNTFTNETVNRTRSARYFSSQHNLCVVTLDEMVDVTSSWKISRACQPHCGAPWECNIESNDYGLMAGFGQTAYNEWDWSFMSNKGQVVTIPMISDGACLASLSRWYPTEDWFAPEEVNMEGNFCAGYVNKGTNSDACYGDDGTAFLCPKSGAMTLRGVLSGWDCSSTPGSPSQFTDVCDYENMEFLVDNIEGWGL